MSTHATQTLISLGLHSWYKRLRFASTDWQWKMFHAFPPRELRWRTFRLLNWQLFHFTFHPCCNINSLNCSSRSSFIPANNNWKTFKNGNPFMLAKSFEQSFLTVRCNSEWFIITHVRHSRFALFAMKIESSLLSWSWFISLHHHWVGELAIVKMPILVTLQSSRSTLCHCNVFIAV